MEHLQGLEDWVSSLEDGASRESSDRASGESWRQRILEGLDDVVLTCGIYPVSIRSRLPTGIAYSQQHIQIRHAILFIKIYNLQFDAAQAFRREPL